MKQPSKYELAASEILGKFVDEITSHPMFIKDSVRVTIVVRVTNDPDAASGCLRTNDEPQLLIPTLRECINNLRHQTREG